MTSILGPEWHISPDGVGIIVDNGDVKDKQKIYNSALNIDLKEICSPVLSNELSKDKTSKIVLQIQKIRNVSAPKANEESQAAPRMLKLSLTDGDSYVQALEINVINSISRNKTPPGTKVLVSNAKITSGYLLLTPDNCTVLGGKVPHLVEKWEIAKSVQRNHRVNCSDDGPPPWVNFGTKIQNNAQETNFKSLAKNKDSTTRENSEFELQRQGAIAEATSGATKKVFSGRVRTNIQPAKSTDNFRDKREQTRSKGKFMQKEEFAEKPQKPVEKISLFSFLEDKLPVNGAQNTAKNFTPSENYNSHVQKEYQHYGQQYKDSNTSREKSFNQNTFKQFEKPYNKNNSFQRETQKSSENHNLFFHHNRGFSESDDKSLNQNIVKQFEKPSNKNPYQKETDKTRENYNVYPTSQAKSNDNRFSHTTQNDFNIPERLQKKQTDKPKLHTTQDTIDNRHHLSDKSQMKPINQSQYSQKKASNDFFHNTSQSNYSNQYETFDRLHNKPRDNRDFNQNQNNNNPYNTSKRSQLKQNENSNSTSSSNHTNRNEPHNHKAKEKTALNTNQMNFDKYSNTQYVKPQEKPQKVDEITASETTISSQNEMNDMVNNTEKLSLNSQFVSRSLRQHLNLGPAKKNETSGNIEEGDTRWSVGDECLAKYWEDGKFYNASITAITEKTFAVRFKGYGNIEEILKSDCLPIVHSNKQDYNHQNRRYDQNTRPYSGSMEFRRSTRNYK